MCFSKVYILWKATVKVQQYDVVSSFYFLLNKLTFVSVLVQCTAQNLSFSSRDKSLEAKILCKLIN